ncbi:MAG: hypothetical protein E6614_37280 [Bradyrhizobium sp.]|nr:hypothetical protein [Bradyrhizobium sp.]
MAETVEIHEMSTRDGVMVMRPLQLISLTPSPSCAPCMKL